MSASIDLSGLMGDSEPTTIKVGDRVYTADPDVSAVFYERVVAWCNGLLTANEDEADSQSIDLVARAYKIEPAEAAGMTPRLRRSMLTFFVTGPLLPQAEPQP